MKKLSLILGIIWGIAEIFFGIEIVLSLVLGFELSKYTLHFAAIIFILDGISNLFDFLHKKKEYNRGLTMSETEMSDFIERIGRAELFEELDDLNNPNYSLVRKNSSCLYPRYFKAIKATLLELNYNEYWINTVFNDALNKRYLTEPPQKISDLANIPEEFKNYGKQIS